MNRQPLFLGLVFNEADEVAEVAHVGDAPHYVINDAGFRRHVPAEHIDRAVLQALRAQILENKDLVTQGALQMLGKDDLFTKAMIDSSIKNIDEHLDRLIQAGLPTEARQWLGMLGFRIVVDHHGDIVSLDQPGIEAPDDE